MALSASNHLYAEHFGLSELPFGVTPNPRFSYNNPCYREAFAKLLYGIEARKGFILITGEAGTGKTTLLKAFMQSVESTVHTAFLFNPKLAFNELLRSILLDLEIAHPSQDRFTLLEKLNRYLIEQLEKNHIVAILVDEAHDLSDELLEEIRLLSNLETNSSRLIQIVLMGQSELEQRLDQPHLRQLKQRIALRCRLCPLSTDEVGSYITHRLRKARYEGKELFEAKAIEKISLNSRGIPRLINVICDNALLLAYASSKKKVSAEMIDEVADDLRLSAPSRAQPTGPAPNIPNEETRNELKSHEPKVGPGSEEFFMEEKPPELYPNNKSRKGMGIRLFLSLNLIMIIGAGIYSQQNGNFVSDARTIVEDFASQTEDFLSDSAEIMKKHFSQATNDLPAPAVAIGAQISDAASRMAVKTGDLFDESRNYLSQKEAMMSGLSRQGWNYLAGLAVKTENLNRKQVNSIPEAAQDNSDSGLAESLDRPSIDFTTPAADESGLMSKETEFNQDTAPFSDSEETAAPEPSKTPPTRADQGETRSSTVDDLKALESEAALPQKEKEPAEPVRQRITKRNTQSFVGNFEVVQDSFLRNKPESDAATTVLPPGTRVRVESREGDYFPRPFIERSGTPRLRPS